MKARSSKDEEDPLSGYRREMRSFRASGRDIEWVCEDGAESGGGA